MSGPKETSDFDRPFPERFLALADAMTRLDHALLVAGMSGNSHFRNLQADVLRHGGATFNDINRDRKQNDQ